jgi:hypothetical protein
MSGNLTAEDLTRLEYYARDMRRRIAMGEAISRNDFIEWAQNATAWVLDKLELAWNWVRKALRVS